jgi:hypothetical protein
MSHTKKEYVMNPELIEKCDLLVKNRDIIRHAIKWENDLMTLAGSSFYVGMGIEANSEKLKESNEILKEKEGIFSEYRGNIKMPLICKMAISENPGKYFEDINTIVDYMKDLKWIDKQYKIMAAITIYDHTEPNEYKRAIDKMSEIYKGMKENHPRLTSGEDLAFAAILAVSDLDTEALLREMEACYELLKEDFFDKNAIQTLSHVLSVNKERANVKCDKVKQIWDLLKEKKHKYSTGYELAVLGTLCMLDISVDKIVEEIIEADDYLKQQKGFGNFSLGKKTRLMFAALMVMDAHIPPASLSHESISSSALAIVIAIEICMMIIISSTVIVGSTY